MFTCARDAGKAAQATRAIPAGWSVAWVVDQADAALPTPAGVERIVAPFKRGPNLFGWEACLGVAQVLAAQAQRFGRVAKVDSDCLLVHPDFLEVGDLAGMRHKLYPRGVYGMAYALSRVAAETALAGVKRAIGEGLRLGPEDAEITSRADARGGVVEIGSFWQCRHDGKLPPVGRLALHCGFPRLVSPVGPAVEKEMVRLGDALGLWRR